MIGSLACEADVERKRKERKEEDPSPFVLSSSPLALFLRLPPAPQAIGNWNKMDSKFCEILHISPGAHNPALTPHPFKSVLTTYQLLQLTTQIQEAFGILYSRLFIGYCTVPQMIPNRK